MNIKNIKIHWVAPNGKEYQDVIPMTIEQYQSFVNNLSTIKHGAEVTTE